MLNVQKQIEVGFDHSGGNSLEEDIEFSQVALQESCYYQSEYDRLEHLVLVFSSLQSFFLVCLHVFFFLT